MECPACGRTLKEKTVSKITVDICEGGCGGVWFDQFELQKLDDGDETAGAELLDIARDESLVVDLERKRNCPRCKDIVMMRHFYGAKYQVTVDSCAGCAGYFLDAGELAAVRGQYSTETEREQEFREDFQKEVGGEMEDLAAKDKKKAEEVDTMLRFVRPSTWFRK